MRLHHLDITAFGPFAESVSVDFDHLSEAGLFLLTGPTGAGKTSVLDAVCFALYGDVPGDRSEARRFRCDTAPPGVAPRVVLTATLAGRPFRLSRSPQWTRPKKRGSGMTTEQASVLVEERVNGEWVLLTGRLDEAGHLVTGLLGMTMPQFCQVAMLPQGRFQEFLRASSTDRHKLLQQLFSTQRFEDIEKWLREHTRQLHRASQDHQQALGRTLSRLLEAAQTTLPEDWPEDAADDLATVAQSGRLSTWSTELRASARAEAETAAAAAESTATDEQAARARREDARRSVDLQKRHAAATRSLADLAAEAETHSARVDQLARARRAAPVRPLDAFARTRATHRDRAAKAAATASLAALALIEDDTLFAWTDHADDEGALTRLDDDRLDSAREEVLAARSRASALRPREVELSAMRDRIAADTSTAAGLEQQVVAHQKRLEELPGLIASLEQRLAAAREARTRATTLSGELARIDDQLAAQERLKALRQEAVVADRDLREVVDRCQSLKESWLELRESRLQGMASEIAHDLAVGDSCPVCGSADHPHKAEPVPGTPSVEAEKQARKELDTAEATRLAIDGKVRDLAVRIAVTEKDAGDATPEALIAERARLSGEHSETTRIAAGAAEIEPTLARSVQSLDRSHREHAAQATELAALTARLEAARETTRAIEGEIETLLDGTDHETIDALCSALDHRAGIHAEAIRLRGQWRTAVESAADADRALTDWLDEHDFSDRDEATGASLPDQELEALADRVKSHDDRVTAARATLDDPDVAAAALLDVPDLAELDAGVTRLAEEADQARTRAQLAKRRMTRLDGLHGELVDRLDAWEPVRESHATAAELTAFVEGKGQDNDLRMRLSAYVLAWRFTQVVAAANERLSRMSDQRYTLEHTGRRGAGETRGGLSLLVRDEWSGDSRDPATLSGGETFVVSLALALGLADVVTREAGGTDLDTLFVDEGFGALDADTLDDVMDTLDTLRDGGRVVGVVSHVAEMRSRIPMQLAVSKDRGGSTLTVTHLSG